MSDRNESRHTETLFKLSKKLISGVVLFAFLLPGSIGVYWLMMGHRFLPSHHLQHVSYLVGIPLALIMTAIVIRPLLQEAREKGQRGKHLEQLGTLACLPFAPLLFFWVQHIFWVGGLMYVLHGLSPKQPQLTIERVDDRGYHRYCGHYFSLEGDSLLTPRKLCRVDNQFRRTLRSGDWVELSGQASRFGFKVESYRKDH